jgi:hypothetical protein
VSREQEEEMMHVNVKGNRHSPGPGPMLSRDEVLPSAGCEDEIEKRRMILTREKSP